MQTPSFHVVAAVVYTVHGHMSQKASTQERAACLYYNVKILKEGESGASASGNVFGWITDFFLYGD